MARKDEARPAVIEALERAGSIDCFRQAVARSLGEVYLMDEECVLALEAIRELVEMDPSLARALIIFARKASLAGCHSQCAEAYRLMVPHAEKSDKVPGYLVEKARCEVAAGLFDEALATFDVVAGSYPAHKAADRALMGRGEILRDRGELERAIAETDRIMESRYADNVHEAVLFRANCQILMGDLDEAFRTYDRVGTDWAPEYAQEAYFNLGEVNLYRGEFDDAQSYYNVTLRQYPDEPRANDAIDRLLLIKSSGGEGSYMPALEDLARALLLQRQGDAEQAVGILTDLVGAEGHDHIRVESLKALAEIYLEDGRPDEAISTYKIVGDSLDAPSSASALEAIGDIYMGLGKIEDAVKAYEDVILKFPESVSAGEARRKIDLASRGPDDEA
jgi:tetratricopeptide (TPR) repeat protein